MAGAYEAYELFQQMYWAYFGLNDIVNASKSDEANQNYHYADANTFKGQWADMNTVQSSSGVEIVNNNIVNGSTVIKPIKTMTDDGMRAAYVIGKVIVDEVTGEVDVTTDGSLFTLAPITDTINATINGLGLAIKDSAGYSQTEFLQETSRKIAEKILDRQIEDYNELNNIYAGIAVQAGIAAETGADIVRTYIDEEVVQEIVDTLSDDDIQIIPVTGLADYDIGEFIHKNDVTPSFNGYRAVELAIIAYLLTSPTQGAMPEAITTLRDHIDLLESTLKSYVTAEYDYYIVEIGSFLTEGTLINGSLLRWNDEEAPNWWKMTQKIDDTEHNIQGAKISYNNNADPSSGTWASSGSSAVSFNLRLYGDQIVIETASSRNVELYAGLVSIITGAVEFGHGICGNFLSALNVNPNIIIDETVLYPPVADVPIDIAYPDWVANGKAGTRYKDDDDTVVGARDIPLDIPRALEGEDVIARPWAPAREGVMDPAIPYPDVLTLTDLYDLINKLRTIEGTDVIDITADPPTTPTPVIPAVPSLGGNAKLYTVHQMSSPQLDALGNYMWSNDFISLIEHMFNNPAEAVIGLHTLYYGGSLPASSTPEQIKLGSITATGVTGQLITNRYMEFPCGTVHVQSYYGNVEDNDPYTKVQIWLPFIGFRDLSTNEVMGGNVSLKYGIDVYTGACVAMITVLRDGVTQALYSFEGNCALTEPITGADYSRIVSGLIGLGVGVATGGVGAAIGAANLLTNKNIVYSRSGSFSANAGAMAIKTPYLLIRRPIAYDANFYEDYYGNPANNTVTISQCSGYTRLKDAHLDGIVCTDDERREIERLLKQGVMV